MEHAVNIWTSAGGLGVFVKAPYWWSSCPPNSRKVTTLPCQGSSRKLFSPSLPTLCVSVRVSGRILIWRNSRPTLLAEWLICMGSNWLGCASSEYLVVMHEFLSFCSFSLSSISLPHPEDGFCFSVSFPPLLLDLFNPACFLQLCEIVYFIYKTQDYEVFFCALFCGLWLLRVTNMTPIGITLLLSHGQSGSI